MANKIQIRRGLKSKLPTLSTGEPGLITDTRELYIGTDSGNVNMSGSTWYTGTAMSGTSATTGAYSYSACPLVKVGDIYLNTSYGYVYQCTTAGSGTTAKWTYKGSIRGATGTAAGFGTPTATVDANTGTPSATVTTSGSNTSKVFNFAFKNLKGATGQRGSQWFSGTAISGTSTTTGAYTWNDSTQKYVGDYYLNTAYGYVYRCTTAGTGTSAKWTYQGSIKGANGSNATVTVDTSLNKNSSNPVKNSVITKYLAGQPIPLTVTGYEYEKMFTDAFMTDPGDAQYYFLDGASLADCPMGMVNIISDGDIETRWDVVKSTDGRVPQTGHSGSGYNLYPTKSYLLRFRTDGEDDGYVYGCAFVVAEFDGTGYDNFWEALILNKLR